MRSSGRRLRRKTTSRPTSECLARRARTVGFVVAGLLCVPLGLQSQIREQAERVDVTRLLIDARVVGDDGEPLLGLEADDFRVKIDDRPVRVESVLWVGGGAELPPLSSDELAGLLELGPRGRLVVFVVQKSLSSDRHVGLLRTLGEAGELLAHLTPDDRVAVLSFDSHLKVWLDFTGDLERVRTVLSDEVMFTSPAPIKPAGGPSLVARLSQELGRQTYAIEDALLLLGNALEPLPGSKSVVLVGYGFGRLTVNLPWREPGPHLFGTLGARLEEPYAAAAAALHAARAAVFCLDITDAEYHTFEHGLQATARDTGGFYVRSYPFPQRALKRVANALVGHYVLFAEQRDREPGVYDIEVELAGAEGTVFARRTYVK